MTDDEQFLKFSTVEEARALLWGIYFARGRWLVASWLLGSEADALLGFYEIEPWPELQTTRVRLSLHPVEIPEHVKLGSARLCLRARPSGIEWLEMDRESLGLIPCVDSRGASPAGEQEGGPTPPERADRKVPGHGGRGEGAEAAEVSTQYPVLSTQSRAANVFPHA
jgi:hypothetical protein